MEKTLEGLNQHFHNKGIDQKARYETLKGIFQYYAKHRTYEGCPADKEVLDMLESMDYTSSDTIQAFFMKFGETFLHRSLDQFYTPCTISLFLGSLFAKCSSVLEPASGSGDLILGVESDSYHCYDTSKDAIELAELNFLLHGKPADICHFSVQDSLAIKGKPTFPLVITNPPFGVKTIENRPAVLKQYSFTQGKTKQQLGLLFIEQSLEYLKEKGILAIIIPTGYLTNNSEQDIRKALLENYRIVGVFFLPDGTFKRSGTGVDTSILIIQKQKVPSTKDYKIFVENIETIGIQTNKKDTPPLYRRDPLTGKFIADSAGKHVRENSLPDVAQRFLTFAKAEKLSGFKPPTSSDKTYVTATRNELLENGATLNVKIYLREFVEIQRKIREGAHFSLAGILTNGTKKKKTIDSERYVYLDISEIQRGTYTQNNVLPGWDLPNRATYSVQKNDILLSKLKGTPSFCMIHEDGTEADRIIATNGVFRLRISDEVKRLTVFRYLFSDNFTKQFNAYTGGSIMANIKEEDLLNRIVFPELTEEALANARTYLHHLEGAHKAFKTFN
jgi:type I restriction enzyme M protein